MGRSLGQGSIRLRLALAAVVVGGACVIFFWAVQSESLEGRVLRWAESQAAGLGLEFDAADLEISLRDLRGTFYDARLQSESRSLLVESESVEFEVVGLLRWQVRLVGPRLRVEASADSEQESPIRVEIGRLLEASRLDSVEISAGRVEVAAQGDLDWLTLVGIDAEILRAANGVFDVNASSRSGQLRLGGSLDLGPLSLEGTLGQDDLRIEDFDLVAGGSRVHGSGRLGMWHRFAELDMLADLSAASVETLLPELPVQGGLRGAVALRDSLDRPALDLDLELIAPRVAGRPLEDLKVVGRIGWQGEQLSWQELTLQGYSGSVTSSGAIAAEGDALEVSIRWDEVQIGELVSSLKDGIPPLLRRSSGSFDAVLGAGDEDWIERISGSARAAFEAELAADLKGTLEAVAGDGQISVEARDLAADGMTGSLTGTATAQRISGRAGFSIADLGRLARFIELPDGMTLGGKGRLDGRLGGEPRQPTLFAELDAPGMALRFRGSDLGPLAVRASGVASKEGVNGFSAAALGPLGSLSARGRVLIPGPGLWDLEMRLEGVDVCHLLGRTKENSTCWLAEADGRLDGPLKNPAWKVEGRFIGRQGPDEEVRFVARGNRQETQAEVEGDFAGGTVVADFALVKGQIVGHGQIRDVQLGKTAEARDLRIEGILAAEVEISGSIGSPRVVLDSRLRNASLGGEAIPDLDFEIVREDQPTDDLSLVLAVSGEDRFAHGLGSTGGVWPMVLELDLEKTPLEAAIALIRPVNVGAVSAVGRARIYLDLLAPQQMTYESELEVLRLTAAGIALESDPFSLKGDLRAVSLSAMRVRGSSTDLTLSGTLPLGVDAAIDARILGTLDLAVLSAEDFRINGIAEADMSVLGTGASPEFLGRLTAQSVDGSWGNLEWSGLAVDLTSNEDRLFLEARADDFLGGRATAQGELSLGGTRLPQGVQFSVVQVDLARLMEDSEGTSLLLSANGRLEGSAQDRSSLRGSGTIDGIEVAVEDVRARSLASAAWTLSQGRLLVQPFELVGQQVRLTIVSDILATAPSATIGLAGDLDLAVLNSLLLATDEIRVSGRGELDLEIQIDDQGTLSWDGSGDLSNLRVISLEPAVVLTNGSAALEFDGEELRIVDLVGSVGGGAVTGGGTLRILGATLVGADLGIELDQIGLEVAEGASVQADGNLTFSGTADGWLLGGEMRVLQGLFDRDLDFSSEESQTMADLRFALRELSDDSFLSDVRLDIRLVSEGQLQVDNDLTSIGVVGDLRLRGNADNPSVFGNASLETGTLRLGRNLFDVERGVVVFNGYPAVPPELDFVATTDVAGTTIRMALEGSADSLKPSLTSPDDARVTEQELASLLLTGSRGGSGGDGTAGAVSAQAAARLGDLFQRQVGLGLVVDVPTTMPILEGATSQQNVVTVGKEITDNLRVGYNVGLGQSESQFWVVDYQPTERIWFRVFQEASEVYTIELAHRLSLKRGRGESSSARSARRTREITISGEPEGVDGEFLLDAVRLKADKPYSFTAGRRAANDVENRLRKLGFRDARVQVVTKDAGDDLIDLELNVAAGSRVEFAWIGDELSEKFRRRVEGQWRPGVALDFQAADLAARAEARLRSEGFLWASVSGAGESSEDLTRLVLDVEKGVAGGKLTVEFEGNRSLTEEELMAALPDRESEEFFFRLERRPGALEEDLSLFYASEGFLDADLLPIRWATGDGSADRTVILSVLEGHRACFGEVALEGVEDLSEDRVLQAAGLLPGTPAQLGDYVEARGRLRELYRNEGYFETRVDSRVERRDGVVNVFFTIFEGRRARVDSIEVLGNRHTLESVIRRRLTFGEGDELSMGSIDESRRRLLQLGAFRAVEIDHRLADDPTTRVVIVRVTERDRVVLDYGLRYRSDDVENLQPTLTPSLNKGLEVVFRPQYRMPFGRADVFEFSLFLNTENVNGRFGYRVPNFFGTYLPTEIYYQHEEKEYQQISASSKIDSLTFLQQHRLNSKLRLQWGYSIENGEIALADLPAGFEGLNDGRFWRGSVTASLIGDHRDEFFSPTKGYLWSGTIQRADRKLGSDYDFTNLFGQLSTYVPVGGENTGLVWAQSYRVGAIVSSDQYFDLDSRFTAGGPFSVRGFDPGTLGIFTTASGLVIGGRSVAIFNQELRFPVWRQLRGGAFVDVGNVFERAGEFNFADLRTTAGLGLRLELPFGVFRGDYGWILDREETEPAGRFHFAFGQAF